MGERRGGGMTVGLWQNDENADDYQEARVYSVWVGGVEVNDYLLTVTRAHDLAAVWREQGHDDVIVEAVAS